MRTQEYNDHVLAYWFIKWVEAQDIIERAKRDMNNYVNELNRTFPE